jgi:hypothetical protein
LGVTVNAHALRVTVADALWPEDAVAPGNGT